MFQMHGMENLDLMGDPSGSMTTLTPMSETPITSSHHQLHGSYHSMNHMMSHHHHGGPLSGHTPGAINLLKFSSTRTTHDGRFWRWWKDFTNCHFSGSHHSAMAAAVAAASLHPDQDTDPRELEAFAERFKQRRIKLGKYLKKTFFLCFASCSSSNFLNKIFQSDIFDLIQLEAQNSILNWFQNEIKERTSSGRRLRSAKCLICDAPFDVSNFAQPTLSMSRHLNKHSYVKRPTFNINKLDKHIN